MAQENDLASGDDSAGQTGIHSATSASSHLETTAVVSVPVSSSESPSEPRTTSANNTIPSSAFSFHDDLPRPHEPPQRSTSAVAAERHSPYDPVVVGRSNSASFDPENAEQLRRRLLMSTPVSGAAVSSRLLQALPQLAIGQLLQDFNNQTPSWRGFTAGRQDPTTEDNGDEAEGLLAAPNDREEGRGGSPPRTRRRLSSGGSIYSMSASGEFERSEAGAQSQENGADSMATARPSGRTNDEARGRQNSEESEDQTAMDELQGLFRRCHNSLPFVALFLIYFAYQHATGILVLVVGTVAVMGLDQRMRAQVALKENANAWHLLGIVAMCVINMVAICSVDGQPNPLRHFSQILEIKTQSSGSNSGALSTGGIFWQVLWTVLVNDFLIRLWSIVVKAFVAGAKSGQFHCERKIREDVASNADRSPTAAVDVDADSTTVATPLTQQAVSTVSFYRRKRKLYGLIEMCSILLRTLLASIPWCSFYQLCASKFMADVFTFAYLFIKGLIIATQGRRIFILARSFVSLGLEFGVYVSHDELVEAGSPDCSICYEPMRQPVKLVCSHMFCEECVTEWFDHERSCPLCRASVGSSGSAEEESMKPQFLDGRTSLVPQLL